MQSGESMAKIVKFFYFMIIFISPFVVKTKEDISIWHQKLPGGLCSSNNECPTYGCPQQAVCNFFYPAVLHQGSRIGFCGCF
ncbi:putative Late nodulin [Medicago truncatula]|uniref:Putative Late nodulin n=1 Tax=Medicago truncatula TaxID=3880 RepID=A0A396GVC4_MEDTR|nr:putative Late nodulin [Medicago truncatula]